MKLEKEKATRIAGTVIAVPIALVLGGRLRLARLLLKEIILIMMVPGGESVGPGMITCARRRIAKQKSDACQ